MSTEYAAFLVVVLTITGLLFWKPEFFDWISSQTNLRGAKMWARLGVSEPLEKYDENLPFVRNAFRAAFAFMSVVFVLGAVWRLAGGGS